MVADRSLTSLSHFRKKAHFRANKGQHGMGSKCNGAAGQDLEVRVPIGTVVSPVPPASRSFAASDSDWPVDGGMGDVLGWGGDGLADGASRELLQHGDRVLLLAGGRGGRGNASFRSSRNKAPRICEKGEKGIEQWFDLELKLVADVGLVGAPNAGKSTLLSAVTNAKPKVAPYPFTTLVPNLGVCSDLYHAGGRLARTMLFADIPGLLEGAHAGVGIGQEFLRHCDRCKVLVQVVDGSSPDPLGDYEAIRTELLLFSHALAEKPHVVAINKIDVGQEEVASRVAPLRAHLRERGVEVHLISALARLGTADLARAVGKVMQRIDNEEGGGPGDGWGDDGFQSSSSLDEEQVARFKQMKKEANVRTMKRDFADFTLSFQGEMRLWVVQGRALESFVQMTDWNYYQAWKRFQKIIKVSGLHHALEKRGVKDGDTVAIGEFQFQWDSSQIDKDVNYYEWEENLKP